MSSTTEEQQQQSTSSTPAFTLRAATAADVPLILTLIKELAEFERLLDQVTATEATLAASLFGQGAPTVGSARVLLATETASGQTAGFALYFFNFSTFVGRPGLYLEDLYVRDGFRGRGLGRQVFGELGRVAREAGCGRMEWAVLDWNSKARDFYGGLGAAEMDGWILCRLAGRALEAI
ncbi:acyl-CoA N-acyltransferase [Entophlyctis helioformis]|nr:acyl-CoA N-acyltransferase [Entophlyctis helioformis]